MAKIRLLLDEDVRPLLAEILRHFVRLDQEYRQSGREHFGILLAEQVTFRELLRRSLRVLSTRNAEEIKNNLFWLNDET